MRKSTFASTPVTPGQEGPPRVSCIVIQEASSEPLRKCSGPAELRAKTCQHWTLRHVVGLSILQIEGFDSRKLTVTFGEVVKGISSRTVTTTLSAGSWCSTSRLCHNRKSFSSGSRSLHWCTYKIPQQLQADSESRSNVLPTILALPCASDLYKALEWNGSQPRGRHRHPTSFGV